MSAMINVQQQQQQQQQESHHIVEDQPIKPLKEYQYQEEEKSQDECEKKWKLEDFYLDLSDDDPTESSPNLLKANLSPANPIYDEDFLLLSDVESSEDERGPRTSTPIPQQRPLDGDISFNEEQDPFANWNLDVIDFSYRSNFTFSLIQACLTPDDSAATVAQFEDALAVSDVEEDAQAVEDAPVVAINERQIQKSDAKNSTPILSQLLSSKSYIPTRHSVINHRFNPYSRSTSTTNTPDTFSTNHSPMHYQVHLQYHQGQDHQQYKPEQSNEIQYQHMPYYQPIHQQYMPSQHNIYQIQYPIILPPSHPANYNNYATKTNAPQALLDNHYYQPHTFDPANCLNSYIPNHQ